MGGLENPAVRSNAISQPFVTAPGDVLSPVPLGSVHQRTPLAVPLEDAEQNPPAIAPNFAVGGPAALSQAFAEKDFPRYINWSTSTGQFSTSGVSETGNKISANACDKAAGPTTAKFGGMAGGFCSASSNGTANGVLWCTEPSGTGDNTSPGAVTNGWLIAFDLTAGFSKPRIWCWQLGTSGVAGYQKFAYPTINNGAVYTTMKGCGTTGCTGTN